ncbi:MAG: hypothetical protein A2031_05385 [Deltaproteobacteria bacterium RBG_19FT_COMBO_43_11]|nr:MAG: hypothetical protein A2W27_09235 [Deltaproteobacteria bacterium RBG_16_44_11]OGP88006.1 MAG: hypothetical protein A2031_05385 [Deltaproteobacteria bacterium RBG_19FT_COMBO_43_11]
MLFSNDVQTEIARVFSHPSDRFYENQVSLMYLLRRDLQNQYGQEDGPPVKVKSPLLTCLGIMVGFELLTKLWSGEHETCSALIENFLNKVAQLQNHKSVALVQFRHAIAHGYRLGIKRKKDKKFYSFVVDDTSDCHECIQEVVDSQNFLVNIWKLKKLFLYSIKEYKRLLEADFDLQKKFMVCLANLGDVQITNPVE